MKATDFWNLNDPSKHARLNLACCRRVFVQGQMSSRFVIVPKITFEDPTQLPLVNNDDVVQALAANTADDPLHETILPRTPWCRSDLLNAHPLHSCREVLPIDTIAISNQITWSAIIGKPFNNLLCRPHSSRVLGDIEMQDATPVMRKNHEDIQDASLNCRDREEIDRNELPDMIAQKCSPCLRWFLIPTRHQT